MATKQIQVRYTATMLVDLQCFKTVDVPEELEGQELHDYLYRHGRENVCGSEYEEYSDQSGDWQFGDAYFGEDY